MPYFLPVGMTRGRALSGMKTSEARLVHSRFSHSFGAIMFARKTAFFNLVFNTDVHSCSELKCNYLVLKILIVVSKN